MSKVTYEQFEADKDQRLHESSIAVDSLVTVRFVLASNVKRIISNPAFITGVGRLFDMGTIGEAPRNELEIHLRMFDDRSRIISRRTRLHDGTINKLYDIRAVIEPNAPSTVQKPVGIRDGYILPGASLAGYEDKPVHRLKLDAYTIDLSKIDNDLAPDAAAALQ
jgi:hypothetical protein